MSHGSSRSSKLSMALPQEDRCTQSPLQCSPEALADKIVSQRVLRMFGEAAVADALRRSPLLHVSDAPPFFIGPAGPPQLGIELAKERQQKCYETLQLLPLALQDTAASATRPCN